MSVPSPTIQGFRAAFRRPSLTFAEIAWRWTIGATTIALFVFYCIEYLDTLPVDTADSILLSTRQPMLVGKAIAHILRGSLDRAILAALFAALALLLLWIVTASIGRVAIVRALLAYFREDAALASPPELCGGVRPRPIRALIDLSFLRAAVALAMILAFGGAVILAGFVSVHGNTRPSLEVFLFLPLAALICMSGWALNWWLSLAGIYAVRDGKNALGSLSAAVSAARERTGSVLAVSTWTGLAHLVAFSIAATAVSLPLAFIRVAPSRFVIAGVIVVALAYFAVVDWLYIARLAGYLCIAEISDDVVVPEPNLPAEPHENIVRAQSAIDRDEPILSDLSNFAAGN
ncbi:MAG: hypothetical protein WAL56_16855 [Candidatus Sulfotelmatobacter sp.]